MSQLLESIGARYDGLSRRERWIVLVGFVALVVAIGDRLLLHPLDRRSLELSDRHDALEERSLSLASSQSDLEEQLVSGTKLPVGPAQSLRGAIDDVDAQIAARAALFVPPSELMSLLEAVLERQPGVRVQQIEALEPVGLVGGELAPQPTEGGGSMPQIYRHGMRIDVEASYVDTVIFLQRLESLPWALFWESLDYEVTEYPRARVRLLVHTLSTAEHWRDA